MRVKRFFVGTIAILILCLAFVYMMFRKQGIDQETQEPLQQMVLRVLISDGVCTNIEKMEKLVQKYEMQNEGIDVQIQWADREDIKKNVCFVAENTKRPDMVLCGNKEISGFMDMGFLQSVSSDTLLKELKEHAIYPSLWQSVMRDGEYYGFLFDVDPYVLYCNKEYLQKKQIAEPNSWDEILKICSEMGDPGILGVNFGVRRTGDAADFFDCLLYACGGTYYNLDEEAGKMAAGYLDEMKRHGYISKNVINYTPKDAAKDFAEGKAIMLLAPLSIAEYIKEQKNAGEFSISLFPGAIREGKYLSGNSIGVLKDSNPKIIDFIYFLYEQDSRNDILSFTGTIALFEQDYVKSEEAAQLEKDFKSGGIAPTNYGNWFSTSSTLADSLNEILVIRNMDLNKEISDLQDKMQVELLG